MGDSIADGKMYIILLIPYFSHMLLSRSLTQLQYYCLFLVSDWLENLEEGEAKRKYKYTDSLIPIFYISRF